MAKKRYERFQSFSGINMTPLMDLTFLLLIVFMITAPILEYSVDVSPPEMKAEKIEEENSLLIGLTKQGEVLYKGKKTTLANLHARLKEIRRAAPRTNILIRADQNRPYREVVEIMKTVRKAEMYNIALVTRAEDQNSRR